MASLIMTQQSDLYTRREVGTFGEKTFIYNCTQDENLPTCAPSGFEPPAYHIPGHQHWLVHHGLTNSATKRGHVSKRGKQKRTQKRTLLSNSSSQKGGKY